MSNYAMQKFGGGTLDIHAGGVDLKFPHHENEIAQSEGYSGCHQWVNYWLHMGHLHIKGRKMSKSLKNFITIREALELNTSRQLRFCFLLHKYNMAMDYSDETMTQAVNIEKIFSEFFHNTKAVLRKLSAVTGSSQFVGPQEEALLERVEVTKSIVKGHLMNDFDTPKAMAALVELVRDCNKYLETVGLVGADSSVSSVVLASAARYITSILRTFGLVEDGCEIGFPLSGAGAIEGGLGGSKEQLLAPYLDILTDFRKKVRLAAMSGDTASVLNLVDALRDEVLPKYGVRMEDKGSGVSADTVWKLEDPETLLKEMGQKDAVRQAKEKQKEDALKLQLERDERAKIPPSQMFVHLTSLYSLFDSDGVPTHDASGEILSKGVLKRLQKEFVKQKETHEKYLTKHQTL
jgi:cysteinyl-tRNA synthetase